MNNQTVIFGIFSMENYFLLAAKNNKGIFYCHISDNKEKLYQDLRTQYPDVLFLEKYDEISFNHDVLKIISFFKSPSSHFLEDIIIDMQGTKFQQQVWNILRNIGIGTTLSYSQIAQILGKPKTFRAVANACASNNIALLIPCHRAIKKDGNISGYKWGLDIKNKIILREKIIL